MDNIKKYGSLALLLLVGLVIAIAEPQGFVAAILVQVLALAVIGSGAAKLSKVAVSLVVLAVAGVLAWFKVDGAFPAFPAYAGDPAAFAAAAFAWVQAFVAFAAPIVGSAMLQYNVILEKLLKIIGGSIGLRLEPK